jgi:hypothetical protein
MSTAAMKYVFVISVVYAPIVLVLFYVTFRSVKRPQTRGKSGFPARDIGAAVATTAFLVPVLTAISAVLSLGGTGGVGFSFMDLPTYMVDWPTMLVHGLNFQTLCLNTIVLNIIGWSAAGVAIILVRARRAEDKARHQNISVK